MCRSFELAATLSGSEAGLDLRAVLFGRFFVVGPSDLLMDEC